MERERKRDVQVELRYMPFPSILFGQTTSPYPSPVPGAPPLYPGQPPIAVSDSLLAPLLLV